MKKLLLALLSTAALAEPISFEVKNPSLSIDNGQVSLGFLVGDNTKPKDVKILFFNTGTYSAGLTENSELQPADLWFIGSDKGKTTTKQMILDGWILQQVVGQPTAKQFYLVFVK